MMIPNQYHHHQQQQQQQQQQTNLIPKIGLFWNLFETSISFHISISNILSQLRFYANSFGQIKQFSILLDLSNSNATLANLNLIKQEIKQFGGLGNLIQIIEFNNKSSSCVNDRSELVCKIWEFVYDNFDSSISNQLHIILIDRFSNDSPIIKPLTIRGIKVTTLLNPIPPTNIQQQQQINSQQQNNNQISPDTTHHSFFSEDINYGLSSYYSDEISSWKSNQTSPTLSPIPSYSNNSNNSNNNNNNNNSNNNSNIINNNTNSNNNNNLSSNIVYQINNNNSNINQSNSSSSTNLYISTSPISSSPLSSTLTSPNSNSPQTSPVSLTNSTSSITSQHFKQQPPQHSLTASLSNLSITNNNNNNINSNSNISNISNISSNISQPIINTPNTPNKNLIQSPRPLPININNGSANTTPILTSSYSSLSTSPNNLINSTPNSNINSNNNNNNNSNNSNSNSILSNSTNNISSLSGTNKIIIPSGIADNPSLQNLYTVIQGLKDDGFRPTFKVILPRLGTLMGMRVQRSHFEKILEKAKNHNFNVDYSTKTIYYKDDNYGGADPHRAEKSHFSDQEIAEFLEVIDKSQLKVFPSRYNMVMWLTAQNLPEISKLKQGQIVELCQYAINENIVSLDENLKKSKKNQNTNNNNNTINNINGN